MEHYHREDLISFFFALPRHPPRCRGFFSLSFPPESISGRFAVASAPLFRYSYSVPCSKVPACPRRRIPKEAFVTNYLFQFARILAFCFLGEVLHALLPLPIPASIYGLVLLLAALRLGLVRLAQVREVGLFLTGIFPLLFVPAAAGIMELWAELAELLLPIFLSFLPVTVLVMVSAGLTTQSLSRRKKEARHD